MRNTHVRRLTDTKVKNAKPGGKPKKLFDGGGLYLLISVRGTKYWKLKYRYEEKERALNLGSYASNNGGVSLAQARLLAEKARGILGQGINPSSRMGHRFDHSDKMKFKEIAQQWHAEKSRNWTEGHSRGVWRSLQLDVFNILGDIPVSVINSRDCLEVLRAVEDRAAFEKGKKIKQRLTSIFNFAIVNLEIDSNPMLPLKDFGTKTKTKGYPAIPDADLARFLRVIESTIEIEEVTKLALMLLAHVFLRSNELRGATWSEINFENKEWTVPGKRMKNRLEHVIPLTKQSIKVLKKLHEINGALEFVFASPRNVKKPIGGNTLNAAIRRLGFTGVSHGFRKIASTTLNEKGFKKKIVERQLSHVSKNKVEGVYNRAQYLKKRREAMTWYSDYLEKLMMGTTQLVRYQIT